mgnify:CR=1 FL=1
MTEDASDIVLVDLRPEAPRAPQHGEGRFGIGSLINRMTGTAADTPVQRPAAPPAPAPVAQQAVPEEDERIEIPAFLRRQAN